jgi:hypothetical protein
MGKDMGAVRMPEDFPVFKDAIINKEFFEQAGRAFLIVWTGFHEGVDQYVDVPNNSIEINADINPLNSSGLVYHSSFF